MCGIAGILDLDGAPPDPARLRQMAALMAHRGPDGEGIEILGPLGLAFRRLAILDLSEAGRQPMSTPDGRFSIVLNGEIYNHAALRKELEASGVRFRSRTDTEVLLQGWARWGERTLERLEGMFAFAVWDLEARRLTLARDRFGIKPLYYAETPRAFAFASEIKPVLAALDLPVRPRTPAAYDLLVRGLKDHRPETFFEGVLQLMPGQVLEAGSRPRSYYDLAEAVRARQGKEGDFQEALAASVRSHLRSDVPTGSCLSGGLDSSTLVCHIQRLRQEAGPLGATPSPDGSFHTFSARSEDPDLDEGTWIEAMTRATGLPNHPVLPKAGDFLDALPDLLWHQEEPFTTGSPYAQWRVMQEASALGVKVLLDGQGADELLGGYPGMHLAAVADDLRSLRWDGARRTFREVFPAFPRLQGAAVLLGVPPSWAEPFRREGLTPALVASAEPLPSIPALDTRFGSERLRQVLRHLPALLHYEDRNAMAHGVEARVPYLDRNLAELSLALPGEALYRNGLSKAVLRGSPLLPEEVRKRSDKIGFTTPDRRWMKEVSGRLQPLLEDLARSESPWMDWKAGPPSMPLLILELWRRQVLSPGYLEPRRPGSRT